MILNYCIRCGEALQKHDDTCYECANGHQYFNNPHTGTSIVFIRAGKVLLVKRRIEPHKGKYGFPGGFLEYGEDPYDAARREVKEETGVDLTELEILDARTHYYDEHETSCAIMFLAKSWNGTFRAQDDAESIRWVPFSFLNSNDVAWHYPGLADKLEGLDKK